MFPASLAELAVLALLVWGLYKLFEPLRRRLERFFLRVLDPSKKNIMDAEVVAPEKPLKKKEEWRHGSS